MQMQWKSISRRLLTASVGLLLPLAAHQASAATINGTLTVTATVSSYFTVTFGGTNVTPGTTGTSSGTTGTATVAFGTINASGTGLPAGVTSGGTNVSLGSCTTGCFEVSTPVTIDVTAYNASSTTYTVQAKLASSDSTFGYAIGTSAGTALTSTLGSVTGPETGGAFDDGNPETINLYLAVPNTVAPGALTLQNIDLVITAN